MPLFRPSPLIAFLAWMFFFLPPLLGVVSPVTVLLVPLSALLLWPLALARPTRLIALAVLTLIGASNIVHTVYFGNLIDEFFIFTTLRTNSQEAKEFLFSTTAPVIAKVGVWLCTAAAAGSLLERHAPAWQNARPRSGLRRSLWMALCIWLIATGWALHRESLSHRFVHRLRHIYPLHLASASLRQMEVGQALFYAPLLPTTAAASQARADTVVVVLGESASAARWSLLGYEQEDTNGPLHHIPGLQAARSVAHGFVTSAALPWMLTGMDALHSVQHKAPSFIDLAHSPQGGYKTFVFTNSRFFESTEDFLTQTLRRSADVYRKVGDGTLDEVLTEHLTHALQDPAPHKLIVLHTYGSHVRVEERYPHIYQLTDPYDNSIRYTSDLLAQWITLVDQSSPGRPATLLYASDHGVVLPPCADGYQHGLSLTSLEVPLLVWGNSTLRQTMPQLLPQWTAADGLQALYSNALLAQIAVNVTGFDALAIQTPWSNAHQPQYQNRPWEEVRQTQACTLQ